MSWKTGRGDSAPASRPAPRYRIWVPKPGEVLTLRILDHTFTGVDTHWCRGSGAVPSRTIGCIKGSGCPCESVGLPFKWHGYIGCTSCTSKECGILSLTERGKLALEDVAGMEESLRGLKIQVRRATDHACSRCLVWVLAEDTRPVTPPPFDLMPTLMSVYGPAWADHYLARTRGKDGAS